MSEKNIIDTAINNIQSQRKEITMNFKEVYQTVLKDYPEIMSVEETSAALGVSTKTVYKMLKNGTIQNMKVGRSYRVPKVHLLSFLKINMAKA